MTVEQILAELKSRANETNRAGMGRFGIKIDNAFGVSVRELREIAKPIRRDHALAIDLWNTGTHEARLLATIIADADRFTEPQIAKWLGEFDSWDVTDGFCGLLTKHPKAWTYAKAWVDCDEEFVKRAAFALMARLAVHDKNAPDRALLDVLPLIVRGSTDERNFVKKAATGRFAKLASGTDHSTEPPSLLQRSLPTLSRAPPAGSPTTRSVNSRTTKYRLDSISFGRWQLVRSGEQFCHHDFINKLVVDK